MGKWYEEAVVLSYVSDRYDRSAKENTQEGVGKPI